MTKAGIGIAVYYGDKSYLVLAGSSNVVIEERARHDDEITFVDMSDVLPDENPHFVLDVILQQISEDTKTENGK